MEMLASTYVKNSTFHLFPSLWQIQNARRISRFVGKSRPDAVHLLDIVPPSLTLHPSRTFPTLLVTMTVITALLQATSLISSLSQLRTNGKHSSLLFQDTCVVHISRETLCLRYYSIGASQLGALSAPKLPQFLKNK